MTSSSNEEALTARLRDLEAENQSLRSRAAASESRPGWRVGIRTFAAVLCISLAAVLVPFGILANWAQSELLDESRFVDTFAPLAEHPAIQAEITSQVVKVIDAELDIDGLTDAVFDGVIELGLPDNASAALNLLRQPAADGVRSAVSSGVSQVVASDVFDAAWEQALRVSHRAFLAAASQNPDTGNALTIDSAGTVAIQLAPIIESVKISLADRGFAFSAAIPVVEAELSIVQSDALPALALAVTLTTLLGWWLPAIAAVLLVAGVLVAPRRLRAVSGAGVGLMIGSLIMLMLFEVLSAVLSTQAPTIGIGAEALAVLFTQVVNGMRSSASAILVFGLLLAVLGFSFGTSRASVALRESTTGLTTRLQSRLTALGLRTTAVGHWLFKIRMLTRVLLLALVWLLLLLLPLTVGWVLMIAGVALLIWWLLIIFEVPGDRGDEAATIESNGSFETHS
ncbi:hypothetical protein ACR5KS_05340 [Leucobacter sp. W1153]|uniref:hypothetical protein n=1 Tax=Leucobacter sp. W1153 TaxID=3439064 RepID=UPI003F3C81A3